MAAVLGLGHLRRSRSAGRGVWAGAAANSSPKVRSCSRARGGGGVRGGGAAGQRVGRGEGGQERRPPRTSRCARPGPRGGAARSSGSRTPARRAAGSEANLAGRRRRYFIPQSAAARPPRAWFSGSGLGTGVPSAPPTSRLRASAASGVQNTAVRLQ